MLFKTSIKKCFILTALLMLLTGCTINYNLTIDNNSVSESISGSVDKNEYELEDGDTGLNLFYTLIKKDVPASLQWLRPVPVLLLPVHRMPPECLQMQ